MFKHLLIATDFSPSALLATAAAVDLAKAFDARITIAHAPPADLAPDKRREREDGLAAIVEERFQQFSSVDTRLMPLEGAKPHEALVELATSVAADLILVGRHGQHNLSETVLGGTSERLIRHAPCSVLVVNPAQRQPVFLMRHILATTDFSDASLPAIDGARELARRFDAFVSLLHAYDLLPVAVEMLEAPYREGEDHSLAAQARRRLEDLRVSRLDGVPAETVLERNKSAVAAVCDYASLKQADLVVVGSHGRTGLSRFLLGSVAERVVRHAPTSVLVMRSGT